MLGLLVGAAFGIAGALIQTVARNPLASPDVIGITQGAGAVTVGAMTYGVTVVAALPYLSRRRRAHRRRAGVRLRLARRAARARFVLIGIGVLRRAAVDHRSCS